MNCLRQRVGGDKGLFALLCKKSGKEKDIRQ
jgi:hypothetical protein